MVLVPVILSGGSGSRLWPVSRELQPKPFIRLPDGQSLIQKAFLRASQLAGVGEILTVTNRELSFQTEDHYAEVNNEGLATSFILEPFGRDTAPAIALAALQVKASHGDNALMLVLTADHLVNRQEAFAQAVNQAVQQAQAGYLVTFGIVPSAPETGFGYIEADLDKPYAPPSTQGPAVYPVKRFVEKPDAATAAEYLATGRHYWNSGMFCFRAGTLLEELAKHAPAILAAAQASFASARISTGRGFYQLALDADSFAQVPAKSIDYALMEKSSRVAVVPCDIGWSDIGGWLAMGDLYEADNEGNQVEGQAILHDAKNCIILSPERTVAALGVENLVVVDTHDALLVADKSRVQDVKQVVSKLKETDNQLYRIHTTVHRPWGTYSILEEGSNFKIKRIVVAPGGKLSLQSHKHRSEHWVVLSGIAKVLNDEEEFTIHPNQSTYIYAGHKHQLENPGDTDLVIIEVQSGNYLGEDDIVRYTDIYGRV
jgi:mannose-1-phosphate guanylyltransferase/mannose-6-phosphate isomerase